MIFGDVESIIEDITNTYNWIILSNSNISYCRNVRPNMAPNSVICNGNRCLPIVTSYVELFGALVVQLARDKINDHLVTSMFDV